MNSVIQIGTFELALAAVFVFIAAGLSMATSLGVEKSLLIAAARTYLQLIALGMVLTWIFDNESPLLVISALVIMTATASRLIVSRVKRAPGGLALSAFWSVFISGISVTFAVTAVIVKVDPWYRAQYVIPLAGMVIGNSMNGVSLAVERLFDDMRKRKDEINVLLALGATGREAAVSSMRTALSAGLIPVINSMSAAGIVSIPGMMTGQILSGVDPSLAARYQIVVMLMLSAATAIGSLIAVELGYKKVFDKSSRFVN